MILLGINEVLARDIICDDMMTDPEKLVTSTSKMQKVYNRLAVDLPIGIQRQEDSWSLKFRIND